jgi:uracil-DNA glycosylase
MSRLSQIRQEIIADKTNSWAHKKGYEPLYTASETAKLVIIGQAPGREAQESMIPWNDKSSIILRDWLGVSDEQFYDDSIVSLLPMDFYFPGKGKTGDLKPRKDFAPMWHEKILNEMPEVGLIILVGNYSQKYYLKKEYKSNLTETVKCYEQYLPKYFPIVHSSPLNFRWQKRNPWFVESVVPKLRITISELL